ncbi:hypothetical protein HED50_20355 [Ochrobactrum oryzae]|nr:hypothetical protein [Brucella oryzae]
MMRIPGDGWGYETLSALAVDQPGWPALSLCGLDCRSRRQRGFQSDPACRSHWLCERAPRGCHRRNSTPRNTCITCFTTIGDRIPAFASSTGRVLLARLSDLEVQELYKDGFVPPSATSPQNIPDLLARLADTRRQGYAESIDEAVRGVRAISVAVGDPRTGDEAALCISFPDAIVSSEERQVIIRHLRDGAEQIAALVKDTKFIPVAK